MTPFDFLNLLWENKPEDRFILVWIGQQKRSYWFRSLPEAAGFLATHQIDVYLGVGLSQQDYGPNHRCPSGEIVGIPGVWADFDIKSPAHHKDLPGSIEEALELIPPLLPPTIIIATGNGVHAWWLFKEPWIFESESDRKDAEILSSRFQMLLSCRSSERGWGFDRLSDLARLLRVPGTTNNKNPQCPKPITVHSFAEHRYNPSDLQDFLDKLGIPDPASMRNSTKGWAERFADTPLVINPNARIPQDRLDHWLATDERFNKTWFRQRSDLNDQSQSGYDMALACFGVRVGLSPQEIVDLVIHHRGVHRQSQRTRLDYFQRTIAKAEKQLAEASGRRPDGSGSGERAGDASAGDEFTSIDPLITKAMNLERISDALGFRIYRIVKITGSEPFYRMDAEGGKISFSDIGKLSSQNLFRRIVAATINKLPGKLKAKFWDEIVQLMLDSLTEEDGGEEMRIEGEAHLQISKYLSGTGFIDSAAAQNKQNGRNPLILDGSITICSNELHQFIVTTTGQNVSIQRVVAMLLAVDAKSIRFHRKRVDQTRWRLPASQFDPAEYCPSYQEDIEHGD